MMNKRELKEFLIWFKHQDKIIKRTLDVTHVVDMYQEFVNSHTLNESQTIRDNESTKEDYVCGNVPKNICHSYTHCRDCPYQRKYE